jgi:hypothetical protein
VLARVALGQFPSHPDLRRGCLRLMVLHSSWLPVCGRFVGTMALSDSRRPCIMVVSVGFTMRALLRSTRPDAGPPESRTRCFRACEGASTPPGAGTPRQSGVPAVAFRVCGARRHPGMARFRGSIPCLHVPLATLHRAPLPQPVHDSGPGWLARPSLSETCTPSHRAGLSRHTPTPGMSRCRKRERSTRCRQSGAALGSAQLW